MTPEFQAYVECEKCKRRKWRKHMVPVERDCGELGKHTIYYCNERVADEESLEILRRADL